MRKLAAYVTITIVALQVLAGIVVTIALDKTDEEMIHASNIWMLLNATQWVFAFTVIALLTTGLFRQLTVVVIMLWIGKVIDEVFFDPCVLAWNDILNFAIAENIALILITIHLTKKQFYGVKSRP